MNSHSKTANVIGGKTARACDSCLRKRARWFCAADDAFLCQSCDVSVHSANQLASRHERVRIESSSWRAKDLKRNDDANENPPPLWHKGFTKKPRTPRSNKSRRVNKDDHVEGIGRSNPGVLVPEISSEETTMEEIDEQLFCRVPVLDDDTFAGELDDMISSDEFHGLKLLLNDQEASGLDMPVLCTTDMALDELSVDVDSLLGRGIDKGSYANQELCFKGESFSDNAYFENKKLKTEEENRRVKAAMDCDYDPGLDVARESFNWDFDYSTSPVIGEEEELGISCGLPMENLEIKEKEKEKRRINLKINYEEIISAWDCNVSPWINGSKPDINPDDCWPDFLGGGSEMDENSNGSNSGRSGGLDGEREARVLRYRQKRRTRLFAKKIRYEVRKLNAEKRPRMKGRFVKRTSFLGSSVPTCVVNK